MPLPALIAGAAARVAITPLISAGVRAGGKKLFSTFAKKGAEKAAKKGTEKAGQKAGKEVGEKGSKQTAETTTKQGVSKLKTAGHVADGVGTTASIAPFAAPAFSRSGSAEDGFMATGSSLFGRTDAPPPPASNSFVRDHLPPGSFGTAQRAEA